MKLRLRDKKEVGMPEDKGKDPMVQLMATWVHANSKFLVDGAMLRDMIQEIVVKLNMTVLIPTIGARVPNLNYVDPVSGREPNAFDFGLTLFTVIMESHIALHTFPKFNKAWFEVVSCKLFDESIVRNVLYKYFPGCELGTWSPRNVRRK